MTRTCCAAVAAACLCAVALADEKDDATGRELKKLEGVWVVQSQEQRGKPTDKKRLQGHQLEVKAGTAAEKRGFNLTRWTIRLDFANKPKQIDFVLKNKFTGADTVYPGIYELDGDTLKVCRRGGALNAKRPAEFKTAAEDEPGARTFTTYKREKKKP